jgi:hypothetical protein
VRAREVDVGVRVEDELLLLPVDAHGEAAAVALACLPREELPADTPRRAAVRGLLHLREPGDDAPHGVPVGHRG